MTAFAVCSKSPWLPSIRREHAFVRLALNVGLDVVFVEPPIDIRDLAECSSRTSLASSPSC